LTHYTKIRESDFKTFRLLAVLNRTSLSGGHRALATKWSAQPFVFCFGFSLLTHGLLKKFGFLRFSDLLSATGLFKKAVWAFEKLSNTTKLFQKPMFLFQSSGRLKANGCQHQLYAIVAWECIFI